MDALKPFDRTGGSTKNRKSSFEITFLKMIKEKEVSAGDVTFQKLLFRNKEVLLELWLWECQVET